MNPLARSLYRSLLKRTKTVDRHRPIKLLIDPLSVECKTFVSDAFNFYSLRYEPDPYAASHTLQQHVRITFDFARSIHSNPNHGTVPNQQYLDHRHLSQLGFAALKSLSTAFELVDFMEYDCRSVESLPENKFTPPRLADPIHVALSEADEDTEHQINEACMYIKLANACDKVEDRIAYYAKSIRAYETADAWTYLGWMVYTVAIQRNQGNASQKKEDGDKTKNDDEQTSNTKTSMGPVLQDETGQAQSLKDEVMAYVEEDRYLSLSVQEGMLLCMKCDRVAGELDPNYGNSWNDLGVCLMNQLFMSDQSEKALLLFERAKRCTRYSSREYPFLNAARLYLRHRKDVVNAMKEYLGALYFDRDDAEAIKAIKDYRDTLMQAMRRKKFPEKAA